MSEKVYALTEALRDRLIANLEAYALADWFAHSNREQADLLRTLPTVERSGVPSKAEIAKWIRRTIKPDKAKEDLSENND